MLRTYRSLTILLLVSLLWLAGGIVALAQSPEPATPTTTRPITVVGHGSVSAAPDIATVSLGVETQSPDITQAMADNTTAMDAIYDALSESGVADNDVQTSDFSIYFDEGFRGEGVSNSPVFRVSHIVRATIRDLETVSDVIGAAIVAGANRMYGVTFALSDMASPEALAREKAVTNAAARAEHLARLLGASVGEVLSVTDGPGASYPMPFLGGGAADARPSAAPAISPGQLEFTSQIQITYALVLGAEVADADVPDEAAPAPVLTGEITPGDTDSFDLAVTFNPDPTTEDGLTSAGWVDVTRQDEESAPQRLDVLYRTPFETEEQLDLWASETSILLEDINFDGNLDFAVVEPSSATWQVSHWFLYDSESDGFITNDLTEQLSLLPWNTYALDADARTITVTNFMGATGEVETVYELSDEGELTLVSADAGAPTIEQGPFSEQ